MSERAQVGMLIRTGSLFIGSSLIGFLSELYLGLVTLAVFVLAWGVFFLPRDLDTMRYLKMAKGDAYQLLQNPSPNSARIEIIIEKLRRFPKDKEATELIKELTRKQSDG
ncbi:MAG: hypothetical protein FJ004_01835 [Chloroflexi bacterium]|nr:hypothetical protein [Chloroflexota bacterium]